MRLMFDNCLTYNCLTEVTPIHWVRDPCKLLYNELNLLAPTLPLDAKKPDFQHLMDELKKIRLDGYPAYFDFKDNPMEYYPDYASYSAHPMGFNDTLKCIGSFDDWIKMMNTVFDDAMNYHNEGRGSAFVHAEAVFLKKEFNQIIAKETGRPIKPETDPEPSLEEQGIKLFHADTTRMPNDIRKKCQSVLDEFFREGRKSTFFDVFMRGNNALVFVRIGGTGDR